MAAKNKTRKAQKPKAAKTKTKPAKPMTQRATWTIEYFCQSGCTADPEELHVDKGDTVVMKAIGTHIDITFRRSPFNKKSFSIAQGGSVSAEVTKDKGRFPYLLECDNCPALSLPPRIIID